MAAVAFWKMVNGFLALLGFLKGFLDFLKGFLGFHGLLGFLEDGKPLPWIP